MTKVRNNNKLSKLLNIFEHNSKKYVGNKTIRKLKDCELSVFFTTRASSKRLEGVAMGYHTEFKGSLRFNTKLTETQLSSIKQILREDCRDHPEWGAMDLTYIDLALLPDNSGIQWDGSEKTCSMPELVNVVITQMRREFPDFGLTGVISAQGSEVGDFWQLYISDDGFAKKRKLVVTKEIDVCPHCFGSINLSSQEGQAGQASKMPS